MPKYYIAFIDRPNGTMRIPIKAPRNPYNGAPAYCAGMPQFFGGTDDQDQPVPLVLDAEVAQESRHTLELLTPTPHHFETVANMFFYYAVEEEWAVTGTAWGPAATPEQAEMERLVAIDLTRFDADMDDQAVIDELLRQAGSNLETEGGAQFLASATRAAFLALIERYLAGEL